MFILFCLILLLLLRWYRVRDRFGGMVWFKCGLSSKGRVNIVIIYVIITEINYMRIFYKYRYNVNTCNCTIRAMYQ